MSRHYLRWRHSLLIRYYTTLTIRGLFYWKGFTSTPAWINNKAHTANLYWQLSYQFWSPCSWYTGRGECKLTVCCQDDAIQILTSKTTSMQADVGMLQSCLKSIWNSNIRNFHCNHILVNQSLWKFLHNMAQFCHICKNIRFKMDQIDFTTFKYNFHFRLLFTPVALWLLQFFILHWHFLNCPLWFHFKWSFHSWILFHCIISAAYNWYTFVFNLIWI